MSVFRRSLLFCASLFALTACAQRPVESVAAPPDAATYAAKAAAESAAHAEATALASVAADPALSTKDTPPLPASPGITPPQMPVIPAAELRRRILALISSLQGPEQFTPQHIEAMMQVSLQDDVRWQQKDAEGSVTEGWKYWVIYEFPHKPYGPDSLNRQFSIKLSPGQGEPRRRAQMCSFEMEALAQDIVAMGYTRGWDRIEIQHARFAKALPDPRFGIGIRVYQYPQYFSEEEPEYGVEDHSRDCVLRLLVYYHVNRE